MTRDSREFTAAPFTIEDAEFPRDLVTARALYREYAAGAGGAPARSIAHSICEGETASPIRRPQRLLRACGPSASLALIG